MDHDLPLEKEADVCALELVSRLLQILAIRALAELAHDASQIKNPLSRAFRQYKYLLFVDLLLIYRLFHRFIKRTFQFGHFPRFP
jgi:hypothetical protein